jgi:hypothetical protein
MVGSAWAARAQDTYGSGMGKSHGDEGRMEPAFASGVKRFFYQLDGHSAGFLTARKRAIETG